MNTTLRNALIGGLIAIFLSPITIFIGYQLNDYLARDRISIVHVDLIPLITKMPNPGKSLRDLKKLDFGSFKEFLAEDSGLNRSERDLFYKEDGFTKEEREILLSTLERFVNHITRLERDIELVSRRLKTSEEGTNIKEIIKGTLFEEKFFLPFLDNEEGMERFVENILAVQEQFLPQIRQSTQKIIEYAKPYKHERTGKLRIQVTLLNAGNTDGLVMSEGELSLGGMNIPIRGQIKKTEKRSVVYTTFYMHESKAQPENIEKLEDILKKHVRISAVVKIEDFRGNTIQSSEVELPLSDR